MTMMLKDGRNPAASWFSRRLPGINPVFRDRLWGTFLNCGISRMIPQALTGPHSL